MPEASASFLACEGFVIPTIGTAPLEMVQRIGTCDGSILYFSAIPCIALRRPSIFLNFDLGNDNPLIDKSGKWCSAL